MEAAELRRIVSDTGPLLHLREAAALPFLVAAGELYVPPAVQRELTAHGYPFESAIEIRVRPLSAVHTLDAGALVDAGLLDVGEAEAIALSKQIGAGWFLTDDTAARTLAQQIGLETHGSTGVILWAAATGVRTTDECEAALDRLAYSTLWISPAILREARAALARMRLGRI